MIFWRVVTAVGFALASAANLTVYIDGNHNGPNLFGGIFTGLLCIIAATWAGQPQRNKRGGPG